MKPLFPFRNQLEDDLYQMTIKGELMSLLDIRLKEEGFSKDSISTHDRNGIQKEFLRITAKRSVRTKDKLEQVIAIIEDTVFNLINLADIKNTVNVSLKSLIEVKHG